MITTDIPGLEDWIFGHDTGLSSCYLVETLTGRRALRRYWSNEVYYPVDPDDFGRCERMLRRFPQIRERMGELDHPVWKNLVANWDSIVAVIEREVPDAFKTPHAYGSAPQGYRLIRLCIEAAS